MTIYSIPIEAVPNQQLQTQVGNQACQINIYQSLYGLFMDLYSNGVLVIGGVLCLNYKVIVRSAYLGFSGDFVIGDTQGTSDPDYTGLGTRFQLFYYSADDPALLALPFNQV